MKKLTCIGLIVFSFIFLCSCQKSDDNTKVETKQETTSTTENKNSNEEGSVTFEEVSSEQAESIESKLRQEIGEKDLDTGYELGFFINGKVITDEGTFFIGEYRWLVASEDEETGHWSKLCDFILNEDFTEMYEGSYNSSTNKLEWVDKTDNFLGKSK